MDLLVSCGDDTVSCSGNNVKKIVFTDSSESSGKADDALMPDVHCMSLGSDPELLKWNEKKLKRRPNCVIGLFSVK